jgi:hypothetical protein
MQIKTKHAVMIRLHYISYDQFPGEAEENHEIAQSK